MRLLPQASKHHEQQKRTIAELPVRAPEDGAEAGAAWVAAGPQRQHWAATLVAVEGVAVFDDLAEEQRQQQRPDQDMERQHERQARKRKAEGPQGAVKPVFQGEDWHIQACTLLLWLCSHGKSSRAVQVY